MKVRRPRRPAVYVYVAFWSVVATGWLAFAALRGTASPTTVVAGAASLPAADAVKTNPATVEGAAACVKCHKAENAQWMKTVHYTNHKRLKGANATKYATALGIAAGDVAVNSLCTNCHATPQSKAGKTAAMAGVGVSCESCHGGAGGPKGWLKPHGEYGPEGTKRDQETAAHRAARLKLCRDAGKVGPRELYGVAKKCFSCHLVGNEKLVAAGHKGGSLGFEFASWSNGEVRHNFQLDQTKNAPVSSIWLNPVGGKAKRSAKNRQRVMFVLGMLVDLETSLRNRGNANNGRYAGQVAGRIAGINAKLGQINTKAGTDETKAVAKLVPPLFGQLFVVKPGQKKTFDAAADKVAAAIEAFLKSNDGSKLGKLDSEIPKPHFSKEYKQ